MYRQDYKKTPEMVLNEFRRFIRSENSRRKGAFGLNFDTDEGRRFVEEIRKLKALEDCLGQDSEQAAAGFVPLNEEVHFPEEMTDEQILYYCRRKPFQESFRPEEAYYGRLYLLELANGLHHSSPGEALSAIFRFWDTMVSRQAEVDQSAGDSGSNDSMADVADYLLRLSMSFLIANPQLAEEIRKGLVERDLYWRYDLLGEIRQGRFRRAGLFVKKYARLLKPEEISGPKPYVQRTWDLMPEVFTSLDQAFGDQAGHLFLRFLIAGEETSTPLELLPVQRKALGQRRRIPLSDTCYLDSRPVYGSIHKEQWVRTEWVLREGARDFLYVIHLYTESYVREYYRAPKRKRTADRFLKKKYLRTGDDPTMIRGMKEVMRDRRFEEAIGAGVAVYMRAHSDWQDAGGRPKSKSKKERQADLLYQMDHEVLSASHGIDYDKYKQAQSDAQSVLTMLHSGEIDYEEE